MRDAFCVSPQSNGCLHQSEFVGCLVLLRGVRLFRRRAPRDAARTRRRGGGGGCPRSLARAALGKHARAVPGHFLQPQPPLGEPHLAGLRGETAPLSEPAAGHGAPDAQLFRTPLVVQRCRDGRWFAGQRGRAICGHSQYEWTAHICKHYITSIHSKREMSSSCSYLGETNGLQKTRHCSVTI